MSFKEVIGQQSAVAFLKSAYKQGRIAHAYVFAGPSGVGKTNAAINFAKLLLCQGPKQEEPCDGCASCLKAAAGNHPDIQWVLPDGQFIKIDAVREACRRLSLKGFESSRKVLIVSGAQHLNDESSNAPAQDSGRTVFGYGHYFDHGCSYVTFTDHSIAVPKDRFFTVERAGDRKRHRPAAGCHPGSCFVFGAFFRGEFGRGA